MAENTNKKRQHTQIIFQQFVLQPVSFTILLPSWFIFAVTLFSFLCANTPQNRIDYFYDGSLKKIDPKSPAFYEAITILHLKKQALCQILRQRAENRHK